MARVENQDGTHENQVFHGKTVIYLNSATDWYMILQLRHSEDTVHERFLPLNVLKQMGLEPNIDHYDVVYMTTLPSYKDQNTILEEIFLKFNVSHPDDFTGYSLSVSDIVVLRKNGAVSCYYVDSVGFKELPGFLKPKDYLKIYKVY